MVGSNETAANRPGSFGSRIKHIFLGPSLSPLDPGIFHKLSLVAFLAWVGLGIDGVSSSAYGPEEAFLALGNHHYLVLALAAMTAITIFVISASYTQIIELFPSGGGGYVVASRLLSPTLGMISGCALLVDYVLTVTVSAASGSDALFSLLPAAWQPYKILLATTFIIILTVMNLRGVKESVLPIVPVFLFFLVTHVGAILYGIAAHFAGLPSVLTSTVAEFRSSASDIGLFGILFLLSRAYSVGGGTYTGIEAVSNGMPLLKEPRVRTGKRTMLYMAISLASIASGLIVVYLLYGVQPEPGKTLNAVFFQAVAPPGPAGAALVVIALISESLILLVAAQTGFLDGPRVLANMALDEWMPKRFKLFNDRMVGQNGILAVGVASLIFLWISRGSVGFLVVLYSINVFITFSLSQLGMVRHWWQQRANERAWLRKFLLNGTGLILTGFILVAVLAIKFDEGGWLTFVVTASLIAAALVIKRHYNLSNRLVQRLDAMPVDIPPAPPARDPAAQASTDSSDENTAVVLVNGYNGLGLQTVRSVLQTFPNQFRRFVFVEIGVVDVGHFKGIQEIHHLRMTVTQDLDMYVKFMKGHGYSSESAYAIGTDIVSEADNVIAHLISRFPRTVVFTGQRLFKETLYTRILHNYTSFALQRQLYQQGVRLLIIPVAVT